MKRAFLSMLVLAFVAVVASGCKNMWPMKKKEAAPTEEGSAEHGGKAM